MFGACACAFTKSACRSDLAPFRFTGANSFPRSHARFACSATVVNPCSRSRRRTLRWRRVRPWFTRISRIVRDASREAIAQGHGAGLLPAISRAVGELRSLREQCGGGPAHVQARLGNPRVSPSAAALGDEKLRHWHQPRCSQFAIFETSLVTRLCDRGPRVNDTDPVRRRGRARLIDSTRSSAERRNHRAAQLPYRRDDRSTLRRTTE